MAEHEYRAEHPSGTTAGESATNPVEGGSLLDSRKRLFWALQLGGWGAFFLVNYVGTLPFPKPPAFTLYQFTEALSGIIFTLVLRALLGRLWDWEPLRMVLATIASVYLCAIGWTLTKNLVYFGTYASAAPTSWLGWMDGALYSTWVLLCWTGLYFGIKYYRLVQVEREHALRSETLARESQLMMLRYQLNPHFLFNTLNAVSTLILDGDERRARGMINRLSDFLRYSLESDPMQTVSLRQELDALGLYLGIEEVRFGDRLAVNFSVSREAEVARVPSLLLQPIVENAIKYAIAPSETGGCLAVSAVIADGSLVLVIADDGPGLGDSDNAGVGVGLDNTRERLAKHYGEDQSFRMEAVDPHGLRITMCLPYEPIALDEPAEILGQTTASVGSRTP
jgi:two-component system, LytTR family, sensor kinase